MLPSQKNKLNCENDQMKLNNFYNALFNNYHYNKTFTI